MPRSSGTQAAHHSGAVEASVRADTAGGVEPHIPRVHLPSTLERVMLPRLLAGLAVLACALVLPAQVPRPAAAPVAITGVTVIDGTGRAPRPHTTVLVQEGKIVAVGRDGAVRIPARAQRIAGGGKYLIAGLWDTHVHLGALGREGLPTLVQHGITSVRDLGGDFPAVNRWRAEVERGDWLGPRIRIAGPIVENAAWLARVRARGVTSFDTWLAERIPVETEADARKAVDSIVALGAEVLKVRNAPPTDAYRALLAAAQQKGLRVAGHQPNPTIGLAGALAAGQRSIEHIEGLDELDALTPAARDSIARAYAAAAVWITPTLVSSFGRFVPDSVTAARVAGTSHDADLALVTPPLRAMWQVQRELEAGDAGLDVYARMVERGLAGMRFLRRVGVKVLAGTDLGVLTLTPGHSLHRELGYLVDSLGLTPLEAIQAATVEPARYFGRGDVMGTVEPGRLADLVLLGADPLADIRNVAKVELVILRGRVVRVAGAPRR